MKDQRRTVSKFLVVTIAVTCLLSARPVFAGAPLKGVGVSLGKIPGGGCATRTTDAGGKADFGVWPKGNYTLEFAPPASSATVPAQPTARTLPAAAKPAAPAPLRLHVVISGTAAGKLEREASTGLATGRSAPLQFSLDGTQRLVVVVSVQ